MLMAFVKVAEHSGVSAAALALGIGKSLVSKRVAQLESAVKATLFSRSTRRVALTPAGEAYLDFAKRALLEVAGAEERLRNLRIELTGQIRLTAPVSWGQQVLAKRLPEFLRLHPAIEIELLLADRLMDLAHERIDIALRWTASPPPGLVCEPVAAVPWEVVAAPLYLARAGVPQMPADLSTHACMSYWRVSADDRWSFFATTPGSAAAQTSAKSLASMAPRLQEVTVRSRYHANNPEAVAEAALAGLGVALLPRYLCASALAEGRLVALLEDWTPLTQFGAGITAVAAPERMRLQRNRMLLAFLRQQLA